MYTLYLDLSMGAAGDMLAASLYELLSDDDKAAFLDRINSLGIPGVTVTAEESFKCGIVGTHMDVRIGGVLEHEHLHEHDHDHDHDHDHHDHHDHHHSNMADIGNIIDSLGLDDDTASNAKEIYKLIAAAEGSVHGKSVTDIHFHEVGTADAICDIVSVCILMDMIRPDRVVVSPVCTGYGKVRCAHGILPVPAPATANILQGIPMYAGNIEGELCTPTGAALVRFFADEFDRMPPMRVRSVGYGMGTKDFDAANCIRAMLGECDDTAEDVIELSCNIDDMTGEEIGYATGVLLDEGAADVYTTNIGMKKGRPGTKITVMCHPEEADRFVYLLFKHTTTLGIRRSAFKRYVLDRKTDTADSPYGPVSIKRSEGFGVTRTKAEYDDIAALAHDQDISFSKARSLVSKELNEK